MVLHTCYRVANSVELTLEFVGGSLAWSPYSLKGTS